MWGQDYRFGKDPQAPGCLKVLDNSQNIVVFDATKSDAEGNYSIDLSSRKVLGVLTVVQAPAVMLPAESYHNPRPGGGGRGGGGGPHLQSTPPDRPPLTPSPEEGQPEQRCFLNIPAGALKARKLMYH